MEQLEDLFEDDPSLNENFHYIFQTFNTDEMLKELELITKRNSNLSISCFQDLIKTNFTRAIADGDFKAKLSSFCEAFCSYNLILKEIDEFIFLETQLLFYSFLKYSLQIAFDDRWTELDKDDQCKLSLIEQIKTCQSELKKKNLEPKCQYISRILAIISDPWDNPIFEKIFDDKGSSSETKTYFEVERGSIFIERLRIMTSSGCEDFAYKLVNKCYPMASESFKTVLYDLRLILMADQDKKNNFTGELSLLEPADAIQFITRLMELESMNNVCHYMKTIHSRISGVLLQVLQFIMTDSMSKPINSNFHELCVLWVEKIFTKSEDFHKLIQSLGDLSNSSTHLFILTEEILKKRKECVNINLSFCVELFNRVLIINLNEFARLNSSKGEKKAVSEMLCKRFLRFADLLSDCPGVKKECILTAFTLYPSQELLEQILQMNDFLPKLVTVKQEVLSDEESEQAVYEDYSMSENQSLSEPLGENHLPREPVSEEHSMSDDDDIVFIQATRRLDALNNHHTGKGLTDSINYNYLEAPNIINEEGEKVGLSKPQCDDLCILLLGSRQGIAMSWAMDRKELQNACTDYMKNFETQYEEKELSNLKIDYSKFDNLPRPEIDEYCGIEKGYEQFLEEEEELLPPKKKKKTVESKENNSDDFDYLYSSEENSNDTINTYKKKKHLGHSSSDSDFEPSNRKSKDKKVIKKKPKKSKQNEKNRVVRKVKSEFSKRKKMNEHSNNIVKINTSNHMNTNRVKPCMRPNLIFRRHSIGNLDPVPEKKIKSLRLIPKPEFCKRSNNMLTADMRTFVNPSSTMQLDKIKEISAFDCYERGRHFDLCYHKTSISIKASTQNNMNDCLNKVSLRELLACRPFIDKHDDPNTPRPIFKKGQPPDLKFPL